MAPPVTLEELLLKVTEVLPEIVKQGSAEGSSCGATFV
ncbi:hypothetical protein CP8484711_0653 [Chlamydia psittaci 84-8471/1]|nr:hypothetical protein CP8484711_0653 [Chlamydia psittaci 84-8471/1]